MGSGVLLVTAQNEEVIHIKMTVIVLRAAKEWLFGQIRKPVV